MAASQKKTIFGIPPYKRKAKEQYMSEEQKAHFKKILEAWHALLIEEEGKTAIMLNNSTKNHPDEVDRASQEADLVLELRERDRSRRLIMKVDYALRLLSSGDFGFCTDCGEEIGILRLEARPTADLCIDCKNISEIKERQGRV